MLGDIEGIGSVPARRPGRREQHLILNRIAYCYRVLKEPITALVFYRRIEQFKPDDMAVQLNIGHCYLELKRYDEALNYYFKVELLGNAASRAWRPIAWCAFLSRKYDVARDYYARVLEKKPSAHDYLNAGHVEVCVGNMKRGVELYMLSKQKTGDMEAFQTMLYDDEKELRRGRSGYRYPSHYPRCDAVRRGEEQ